MRIIFSRKGFDTGSGGKPSPIVGGCPISLPIPTSRRSTSSYEDLGLGTLVEKITGGKIHRDHLCHNDPYFSDGRWVFGQTGAAQSHLANQGVGRGDIFLFFGLFREVQGGEAHHRIYGYMIIERVVPLGKIADVRHRPDYATDHPHFIGEWNANNTLYLGSGNLCRTAPGSLRLSRPGGPISQWRVPSWLRLKGLSYHGRPERWLANGLLNSVARGQEFVSDIGESHEAKDWLHQIMQEVDPKPVAASSVIALARPPIVIVMLRQPRLDKPSEMRSDPFWEFGSFGCTGCHQSNVLNPRRIHELEGSRIAFAQGGMNGIRLVHLTPPVRAVHHASCCEIRWQPSDMPLRFEDAPILINNSDYTDVPSIRSEIASVKRSTPVAKFASKFRSRRTPVNLDIATQIEQAYSAARLRSGAIADTYEQALPFSPPHVDRRRKLTYAALLAKA